MFSPWASEWVSEREYECIYVNIQEKMQTFSEKETSKWQKFQIKNKIGEKIDSNASCLRKAFYVGFDIKSKQEGEEKKGKVKLKKTKNCEKKTPNNRQTNKL